MPSAGIASYHQQGAWPLQPHICGLHAERRLAACMQIRKAHDISGYVPTWFTPNEEEFTGLVDQLTAEANPTAPSSSSSVLTPGLLWQ